MAEKLRAVVGCMFSGKSDELLRRVTRAEIAGRSVLVFKPIIDDRWNKLESVRSHAGGEHEAIAINKPCEILEYIGKNTKMVAVDEIQFLDNTIVPVILALLERDIEVNFAGLPLDFKGEPFGSMPELLVRADEILRLTAICTFKDNGEICGEDATRTQRLVNNEPAKWDDPVVLIGAQESYAPRCPTHHIIPGKPPIMLK